MARGSRIEGGTRTRILLQRMAKDNGPVIEPVKQALEEGAGQAEDAIKYNIVAADLVDQGALLDSVAKKKLSNGLRWKIGYFEKGNIRKWRRAGWRAHFAEWGTETQPAHHIVARASVDVLPDVIKKTKRRINAALRRLAR